MLPLLNVGKTIINHTQFHHFYRWYKLTIPRKMGGLWTVSERLGRPSSLSRCSYRSWAWRQGWRSAWKKGLEKVGFHGDVPSGKRLHNYGQSPFLMGKLTISMAMFNSKLFVYQRVMEISWDFNGIHWAPNGDQEPIAEAWIFPHTCTQIYIYTHILI